MKKGYGFLAVLSLQPIHKQVEPDTNGTYLSGYLINVGWG